jgi:flagellar biosynthesis protein
MVALIVENDEAPKSNKDLLAIALEYEMSKDMAPKVAATGKGHIASQIIAIARENNIKIHKDSELAQILSLLDIDSIIPVEAYAAVAEILSYIYRTNANLKK